MKTDDAGEGGIPFACIVRFSFVVACVASEAIHVFSQQVVDQRIGQ